MANLYFATDPATRDHLGRRYRRGELSRIRQGIYIDDHDNREIENTLTTQWPEIAEYLFGQPVAVFRTAAELRPAAGRLYLAVEGAARRTVAVGPLRFIVSSGTVDRGVEPFLPGMKRSNPPRQLLENLALSRAKSGTRKTLGQDWVETQLVQEAERRGEQGLNRLRDAARELAPVLKLDREFDVLNKMISALLQTRAGIAHVSGESVDNARLERFTALAAYLQKLDLSAKPYQYNKTAWRNLAFFESYFSNYIEGTRFTIDEAENIASTGKAINSRHEDSHDILSHIEIAGDTTEMSLVPTSPEELIDILKVRHSILMAQRPDKRPGKFKCSANRAGSTVFVGPENVEGTLVQGFDIYHSMPDGIKKALFIHFMVSECHPFDDGNGRLARVMMNAELVSQNLYKIIIPSVCRDNYLTGMRQASRQDKFRTMTKVLHQLHQYTASIDWMDYGEARETLEAHAADQDPDEGLMIFNKTLRQYTGDYQAG